MDAVGGKTSDDGMKIQRAESPALLAGHDAARNFFSACFMGPKAAANEMLWVAHVDDRARCIHLCRYGEGLEGGVDLPVRKIIADAARLGSAGIVLAHNHPSGDPTPSPADCRATRTLARAAEAIDLTLVDHMVSPPATSARACAEWGCCRGRKALCCNLALILLRRALFRIVGRPLCSNTARRAHAAEISPFFREFKNVMART